MQCARGCFALPGTLGQLPDPAGLSHAPTFAPEMTGGYVQIPPPQLPPAQQQLPLAPPSTNWGGVVSPRTAEKILKGQFVDMIELLPDAWRYEDTAAQLPVPRPRRPPVTEITVWVECFSLMAGVIISRYPKKTHDMFQPSCEQVVILRVQPGFRMTLPSGDRPLPRAHSIGGRLTLLCIMRPSWVELRFAPGVHTVWPIHMVLGRARRIGNRDRSRTRLPPQGASPFVGCLIAPRATVAIIRSAAMPISADGVAPSLTVPADSETPTASPCHMMARVQCASSLTARLINSYVIICLMFYDY